MSPLAAGAACVALAAAGPRAPVLGHVRAEHRERYQYGDSEYVDGMIEHDDAIGAILSAPDDLDIADDRIVVNSTDNGPHMNTDRTGS